MTSVGKYFKGRVIKVAVANPLNIIIIIIISGIIMLYVCRHLRCACTTCCRLNLREHLRVHPQPSSER